MKKNYLFLGFAIPYKEMKESFKKDKMPAIHTHKFNWNLIKGIEYTQKIDSTYISSRPISDYPISSEKLCKYNEWSVNVEKKDMKIYEIPCNNRSIIKIITRFLSGVYYSFKNYHNKKNKGGVIVYTVHVPFMLIGYIISRIYKIEYIAIWTDPPSVNNNREGYIKSKLRRLEMIISKVLMNNVSKVISVTEDLAKDFAPNKPYLVVEGIIDPKEIQPNEYIKRNDGYTRIVYTGALEKKYGVSNIVDGFKLIDNEKCILEIYGRGDYEDELKQICKENDRIIYNGFISNKRILEIQRNADFLINARSSKDEYVKYSFPSKTLEYMMSGTPMITTMLPGIPKEYKDYVIVLKDNDIETISNTIKNAINISADQRELIGLRAKEFIYSKNYYNQGEKIVKLIMEQ